MEIHTQQLKNTSISVDIVPFDQLSNAINDLDNRLSDLSGFNPATATSADIAYALSTIVARFGGNR